MMFIDTNNFPVPCTPDIDILTRAANHAIHRMPQYITDMPHPNIAPRQYYSMARYYHPNPDTPDGVPYISRDGIVNPDADNGPKSTMRELTRDTLILGAAGFIIDDKYTAHAIRRLKSWFLDSDKGMLPNLENAQFVPGINMGRPAGVIDSHIWINMILGLDFICATTNDTEFINQMRNWFGQYADWLIISSNGIAAHNIGNNITAWHAAMVMAFALFAGNRDSYIKQSIDTFKNLIDEKMDANGCFAGELKRSRSLHYCLFHLNAMALIAEMAHRVGIDLWNWHGKNGYGLERAFDFMTPYLSGNQKWMHPQITPEHFCCQYSFHYAAIRYRKPKFAAINDICEKPAGFGDIMGPRWMWPTN